MDSCKTVFTLVLSPPPQDTLQGLQSVQGDNSQFTLTSTVTYEALLVTESSLVAATQSYLPPVAASVASSERVLVPTAWSHPALLTTMSSLLCLQVTMASLTSS